MLSDENRAKIESALANLEGATGQWTTC